MRRNYWVCWHDSLVNWAIKFPHPKTNEIALENLLLFTKALLDAGNEEEIFMLRHTSAPYPFLLTTPQSYVDYCCEMARETGQLPFFGAVYGEQGIALTRLHYFNSEGEITSVELKHPQELMQQIHQRSLADDDFRYWSEPGPPIGITSYGTVQLQRYHVINVAIDLYSDIWFPKVTGWLEEQPAESRDELYDNHELAEKNSTRLNSFLRKIRQAALELNGEWLGGSEVHYLYEHMITDDGVRLYDD
jgi:hypothetical protein